LNSFFLLGEIPTLSHQSLAAELSRVIDRLLGFCFFVYGIAAKCFPKVVGIAPLS